MVSEQYYSYDVIVKTVLDLSLPAEVSTDLKDGNLFIGSQVKMFKQTKNIIKSGIPLAQLILIGLSDKDFNDIKSGMLLLEITITQNNIDIYKNVYKIKKIEELSESGKINANTRSVDIVMESILISFLKNDNTFYTINKINETLFTNFEMYLECQKTIQENYGSSTSFSTNVENICLTKNSVYYFTIEKSNIENLKYLVFENKVSTSPVLFGIDEGFNASRIKTLFGIKGISIGNSSEVLLIDLLNTDSLSHLSGDLVNFINNEGYARTSTTFEFNFYEQSFLRNFFTSILRYTNNISNEVFELPPLKKRDMKLLKNTISLPELVYDDGNNDNIYPMSGNLEMEDVKAMRENILKFSAKKPKIYSVIFYKAPYDVFKLGVKNKFNMTGTSINVAADITFEFREKSSNKLGETYDKENHWCSGKLYILNYN